MDSDSKAHVLSIMPSWAQDSPITGRGKPTQAEVQDRVIVSEEKDCYVAKMMSSFYGYLAYPHTRNQVPPTGQLKSLNLASACPEHLRN